MTAQKITVEEARSIASKVIPKFLSEYVNSYTEDRKYLKDALEDAVKGIDSFRSLDAWAHYDTNVSRFLMELSVSEMLRLTADEGDLDRSYFDYYDTVTEAVIESCKALFWGEFTDKVAIAIEDELGFDFLKDNHTLVG